MANPDKPARPQRRREKIIAIRNRAMGRSSEAQPTTKTEDLKPTVVHLTSIAWPPRALRRSWKQRGPAKPGHINETRVLSRAEAIFKRTNGRRVV